MIITVDVETTGVDPLKTSIVSIGAMVFEDPSKNFYEECRVWDGAVIEQAALDVNGFTHEQVTDLNKSSESEVVERFINWWKSFNQPVVIAGHNTFFDLGFLDAASKRAGLKPCFGRRILDQHSLCFAKMIETNQPIPVEGSDYKLYADMVAKFVGLPPEPKPHIALNGAIWETEALSRLMYKKPKLDQFKQYPLPEYLR